ncbi:MAG: FkbM family methyltransferase [Anaerolineales bacterium]|nr:FkbM family methyltransferase [Anaerolineales bacterium]
MVELFLRSFVRFASLLQFLMPISIWLSMQYFKRKYRFAFLEKDPVVYADKLHYLAQLRNKLHPPRENFIVDVMIEDDIRLKANICQQYCGDMYYGIGFEQDEMTWVKQFIKDGDVFFDVGANIGVYTLLASRMVGKRGQVHAFEPLDPTYDLLSKNVKLNQVENVYLNPAAIGDQVGELNLYINAQAALTGLGQTNRGIFLGVQKVPVLTLDDYAARNGIPAIDFLKIDVEGYEGHVLRGAARLIANSPNLIIMSELAKKNFEPLGFSVKEVVDWMHGLGFEAWMIKHDGTGVQYVRVGSSIYPYQNFIFMHRLNVKYNLLREQAKE